MKIMKNNKTLLHVGCGGKYYKELINTDHTNIGLRGNTYKIDQRMNLANTWPYDDDSVDGIVGMGVFQQLHWRDLVFAFREAYRVLKEGGVLRMGVLVLEKGNTLDFLLAWNNVNLFTANILNDVLENIGFSVYFRSYQHASIEEFKQVDNKPDEFIYIEAIK